MCGCDFFLMISLLTPIVIQTTEGRKNLVYIHVYARHCVPEILRFAQDDILC